MTVLNRIALALLGLAAIVVAGAALLWYLAYNVGSIRPARVSAQSIEAQTTVRWLESGGLEIGASTLKDALTSLGFAHATARPWQLFLWRQAALGRLSEWYGNDMLAVDELTRQLRLGDSSSETYEQLPENVRAYLGAYADGVNLAFRESRLSRQSALVLLDARPERWEPWHALAVEKLLAWTGTDPTGLTADHRLRRLLGAFGSEHNTAISAVTARSPYLFVRYLTGDLGQVLFLETKLTVQARGKGFTAFAGLSIPGALVFPAGISRPARSGPANTPANNDGMAGLQAGFGWASLLRSSSRAEPLENWSGLGYSLDYGRIETRDTEYPVQIRYAVGESVVVQSSFTPSALNQPSRRNAIGRPIEIRWQGAGLRTDVHAWIDLLQGKSPGTGNFVLFDGGLLTLSADLQSRIDGEPAYTTIDDAGNAFMTAYQTAERDSLIIDLRRSTPLTGFEQLVQNRDNPIGAELLIEHALSAAMDSVAGRIAASFSEFELSTERAREAMAYLTNWNGSYGANEIAPSILEYCLSRIQKADSTAGTMASREALLTSVLDTMAVHFGSDMSTWRWGSVQQRRYYYPGWTPTVSESFTSQFAPVTVEENGHASTFVWGPPRLSPQSFSGSGITRKMAADRSGSIGQRTLLTSAWEGVLIPSRLDVIRRRPHIEWERFLGSYLSSRRPLQSRSVNEVPASKLTLLVPGQ